VYNLRESHVNIRKSNDLDVCDGRFLILLQKELCNLHSIERCSLLDLITADEQVKSLLVVTGDVSSHSSDKHIILGCGVQRSREPACNMEMWFKIPAIY